MVREIFKIGAWLLLILGASLISFGLMGISTPLESGWHLESSLIIFNIFGGVITITCGSVLNYLGDKEVANDLGY